MAVTKKETRKSSAKKPVKTTATASKVKKSASAIKPTSEIKPKKTKNELPYIPSDYEFKFDPSLEGFELHLANYWKKTTGKVLDYSVRTDSGDAFMYYTAEVLRGNGYKNVRLTGRTADGGLDIKCVDPSDNIFDDDMNIAIQCKFHNKGNAGTADVISAFGGFLKLRDAHRVFLITTSPELTAQAKIQLKDYNKNFKEHLDVENDRCIFIGAKKFRLMINKAVKNGKKDLWI